VKAKILFIAMLVGFCLGAFAENFELAVPKGWVKNEQSAALAQYQKGTGTCIVTADTMPADANTPDKYVDFVKGKLKGAFKDIVFESVASAKKGTYETRELKYAVSMSGMNLKYDVLYVFVRGKAYTLTTGNVEGSADASYYSDIKAFFASFQVK